MLLLSWLPLLTLCSASSFYLEKNGFPEYALDAVLARVEEEHEAGGDGSFVQVLNKLLLS